MQVFYTFLFFDIKNQNFLMKMENSPCWVIKSKAKLENISANQVFEAIYDINIRKKWDFVFDKFEQIKRINDNLDVIYFSISV